MLIFRGHCQEVERDMKESGKSMRGKDHCKWTSRGTLMY